MQFYIEGNKNNASWVLAPNANALYLKIEIVIRHYPKSPKVKIDKLQNIDTKYFCRCRISELSISKFWLISYKKLAQKVSNCQSMNTTRSTLKPDLFPTLSLQCLSQKWSSLRRIGWRRSKRRSPRKQQKRIKCCNSYFLSI